VGQLRADPNSPILKSIMNNDISFMKEALHHAESSLDRGDFPVGCVVTYQDEIIATGERTGSGGLSSNELDHAEMNALRKLNTFNKFNTSQLSLYSTLEPCLMCFGAIMIHQIPRIVYAFEDAMGGGSSLDRSGLPPLYANHYIEIVSGICRLESLRLFQAFYDDPGNTYLAGSYLAKYIRQQARVV